MEFKFTLHEYWYSIPLRDATYAEFLSSFKPLLKEVQKREQTHNRLRDIELFLYLKNNPLLLQKGNEKESRKFLASFSRRAERELFETLLGFLFMCKYDFEGFMQTYEQMFLKFPSKYLSLSDKGEYLIKTNDFSSSISQIYRVFFEDSLTIELEKLKLTDTKKYDEKRESISNYRYENIQEYLNSVLVQEGRSSNDKIEFEYFCENIFPKIQANIL